MARWLLASDRCEFQRNRETSCCPNRHQSNCQRNRAFLFALPGRFGSVSARPACLGFVGFLKHRVLSQIRCVRFVGPDAMTPRVVTSRTCVVPVTRSPGVVIRQTLFGRAPGRPTRSSLEQFRQRHAQPFEDRRPRLIVLAEHRVIRNVAIPDGIDRDGPVFGIDNPVLFHAARNIQFQLR